MVKTMVQPPLLLQDHDAEDCDIPLDKPLEIAMIQQTCILSKMLPRQLDIAFPPRADNTQLSLEAKAHSFSHPISANTVPPPLSPTDVAYCLATMPQLPPAAGPNSNSPGEAIEDTTMS